MHFYRSDIVVFTNNNTALVKFRDLHFNNIKIYLFLIEYKVFSKYCPILTCYFLLHSTTCKVLKRYKELFFFESLDFSV